MFDWQTPGYPEDHELEMRLVDQDEADRRAEHGPSPAPGLTALSAHRSTRSPATSPSSAGEHNFKAAA